uniref:NADH dehydrogenase subunit 4L n=1 Tax=Trouessartia rubecula TaxID=474308 RepID=A0A451G5Q3_9ACAR|nr:NADH dehydrogenase subunit 4L [Trouessartia rubecula]QAB47272.1 NADH dehydrogenase subunit 4L [Trouessartia rubecula]
MMFIFLLFCFFYFFVTVESSNHVMILLIMVEFLVLFSFFFFLFKGISYLSCLFFLLVGVCVGAYSISLFVNFLRYKNSSYLLSFFYF